jgi:N-acetylneuraminic acid mutarotase
MSSIWRFLSCTNGSFSPFDAENGITDTVDFYDPKTSEWNTAAPLPDPRVHTGVATYNGKIYVVGGFDQDDTN